MQSKKTVKDLFLHISPDPDPEVLHTNGNIFLNRFGRNNYFIGIGRIFYRIGKKIIQHLAYSFSICGNFFSYIQITQDQMFFSAQLHFCHCLINECINVKTGFPELQLTLPDPGYIEQVFCQVVKPINLEVEFLNYLHCHHIICSRKHILHNLHVTFQAGNRRS